MGYRVYEESVREVREEAIEALAATREHEIHPGRFDWLYCDNPDGEACLWSIRQEETGQMAGFTVVLPRRMMIDGQVRRGWNGADFSIHKKYRTLGVAVKLRRAAREAIDAGRADLLYSHPNPKMAVIHEKAGHFPVGNMLRYAKPLRSEPYLRRRLPGKRLPALAGALVDPLLKLGSQPWRHRPSTATRIVPSITFDDRFDRLFDEARPQRRIVGLRDARYLNWRYARNPLHETHAILAEVGSRLVGYLLFTLEDDAAHVKDVLVAEPGSIACDLVAHLIRHGRKLRLTNISAVVLEGHPLLEPLARFGFVRRPETTPMYTYASEASAWSDVVRRSDSWLISVGDRDV